MRLSGDGLSAGDEPGMMQGGGTNPKRLQRTCYDVAEEREMDLYSAFRDSFNVEKPRRSFTRLQCIAKKYCTGEENEERFRMEDLVSVQPKGRKKRRRRKRKKAS